MSNSISKEAKTAIRALIVDDLISASMSYNEALSSDVPSLVFDSRAERLCKARAKLLRALRRI